MEQTVAKLLQLLCSVMTAKGITSCIQQLYIQAAKSVSLIEYSLNVFQCPSILNSYDLLHSFREDSVHDLQHLVPELCLFVEQTSRDVGRAGHFRDSRVREGDVCAAVGGWVGIDFYDCWFYLELLGMQNVEDGERIVVRWICDLVDFDVELLQVKHGVVDAESKWMVRVLLESVVDLLGGYVHVGSFQRNHDKGNVALEFEHAFEGCWVKEDIELCCWSGVSSSNCSTHHHNFLDFGLELGISQQKDAEVGEAASVGPNNLILVVDDLFIDMLKPILHDRLFRRLLNLNSSQAIAAMHVISKLHVPIDQLIRPSKHRNLFLSNMVEHIQCIPCGVLQRGISSRSRHSNEIQPFGMRCVEDGKDIIQARVAIQPHIDLRCLHRYKQQKEK